MVLLAPPVSPGHRERLVHQELQVSWDWRGQRAEAGALCRPLRLPVFGAVLIDSLPASKHPDLNPTP